MGEGVGDVLDAGSMRDDMVAGGSSAKACPTTPERHLIQFFVELDSCMTAKMQNKLRCDPMSNTIPRVVGWSLLTGLSRRTWHDTDSSLLPLSSLPPTITDLQSDIGELTNQLEVRIQHELDSDTVSYAFSSTPISSDSSDSIQAAQQTVSDESADDDSLYDEVQQCQRELTHLERVEGDAKAFLAKVTLDVTARADKLT